MGPTLLEQLRQLSVVVADTGDLRAIEAHQPRDATTNPTLIGQAAAMPAYAEVVDEALRWARREAGAQAAPTVVAARALDRLAIEFGVRILRLIPGRVSTEVDSRLSFDSAATAARARGLIAQYEAAGVGRERVLIKIAATWEGIRAAETLEREGIHCNLTLLFGLHQAIACAEAGVTLISPFVGRILDWYKQDTGRASYPPEEDPGVLSVSRIFGYLKHFEYETEIMGASFRNSGEICELAGCDLLTIAPSLLSELAGRHGALPRKLDPAQARRTPVERIPMDRDTFDHMHKTDRMAKAKLAEGIDSFTRALVEVEALLAARLGGG